MADENKIIDLDTLSHFKAKQDLENERKFKKKDDATDLKGAVRYDAAQALTEQEQAQARLNLGISENGGGGGGSVEGAVRYDVKQTLTDEQKAKARENIGADDFDNLKNVPFGYVKEHDIKWDGNIEGKVTVTVDFADLGLSGILCKVAEIPDSYTVNHTIWNNFGENTDVISKVHRENRMYQDSWISYWSAPFGEGTILLPLIAGIRTPCEINGIQFTESGVYFFWVDGTILGVESAGYIQEAYDYSKIISVHEDFMPTRAVLVDENGVIPAKYLPSFVDDVIEGTYNKDTDTFNMNNDTGVTGSAGRQKGKIYIDRDTGKSYRWSGSKYVEMNPPEITFATDADIDALFT